MPNNNIYEFLKDNATNKFFAAVCFILQSSIIALTIARAVVDDLDYAVAVAVINTLNAAYLGFDLWLFGFSQTISLIIVLICDSICTAANILICLVGIHEVRIISFFVLAFSFLLKATIAAHMMSTLVRTITRIDIELAGHRTSLGVLGKRTGVVEEMVKGSSSGVPNDPFAPGDVFRDDDEQPV